MFNAHLPLIRPIQYGFSFIEMLVVVSIVGLITYFTLPVLSELVIRKELNTAKTTLLQTLHRAKTIAETQATIVNVAINNDEITLTPGNTAQDQKFQLPKNIDVSQNTTVNFDSMGMLINQLNDKDITLKTNGGLNLQSVLRITTTGLITELKNK